MTRICQRCRGEKRVFIPKVMGGVFGMSHEKIYLLDLETNEELWDGKYELGYDVCVECGKMEQRLFRKGMDHLLEPKEGEG